MRALHQAGMDRREDDGNVELLGRAVAGGEDPRAIETPIRVPIGVQLAQDRRPAAPACRGGVVIALALEPVGAGGESRRRKTQCIVVPTLFLLPDVEAALLPPPQREIEVAAQELRQPISLGG